MHVALSISPITHERLWTLDCLPALASAGESSLPVLPIHARTGVRGMRGNA